MYHKAMIKWIIGLIVLVVVIGGGLFILLSMKKTPAPTTAPVVEQSTSTAPTNAISQQITVEGNEFAFTPSVITVKQGEEVTVTFKNTGKYPHNFTISDLNVQSDTIQPGEQTTVTFTPDKTGSFTYICTVPGHADKGMKGTLTVQ